jgi:beta-mannosidase
MPARVKSITGHRRKTLASGWELCSTGPGAYDGPEALSTAPITWLRIEAPATVAECLRAAGLWSLDLPARRFDAEDWWYRVRFTSPRLQLDEQLVLGFDGLATVADVWLNGERILHSDNMFLAHERLLENPRAGENELIIRFRALDPMLQERRPRPKWRTPMVENQQLRWFRTTLLGRTPGWSPAAAPVGLWRPVWLETRTPMRLTDLVMRAGVEGTTGWLEVETSIAGIVPRSVTLCVSRGSDKRVAQLMRSPSGGTAAGTFNSYAGRLEIANAELWWPHTHGDPSLYDVELAIETESPDNSDLRVDLGRTGFRTVTLDTRAGDFAINVNGVPIFCRGACWTPDPVTLQASQQQLSTTLAQVCSGGMNMLRVGGTMVYESEAFLEACDAHGVLLWQDFMFANMDYPDEDSVFAASVNAEARQQLERLARHPCLAVLCGNSEGEQQAAMWGAPRETWSPKLFHEVLPELARQHRPDVPYWPSSAHGGAFPHQGNTGTTSYYGVGAYLRPLEDARRAEVRFASECLAFANVPDAETLALVPGGAMLRSHHPAWKARTPRDLGAGWDFDDVRDHYLTRLFGCDPLALRYCDHERYLALSRIVSGEVMAATFAEWRRKRSSCRGALIWFWRDLWCGAGWGIVDALGKPKAAYHYLSRALKSLAVFISDEGGNGLFVHIVNERPRPQDCRLQLTLYREGEIVVSQAERAMSIPARETLEMAAAELFDGFLDLAYAYRFGPPSHDLVTAVLRDPAGEVLAEAFHFDPRRHSETRADLGLTAAAVPGGDGSFEVNLATRRFAQSVWVEAEGFSATEDYFHLAPGARKTVTMRPATTAGKARPLRGRIHALNALVPTRIGTS